VRPAAFLCRLPLLSCPVGRYVPVNSRFILYATLPSTTAGASAITATAVVIAAFKAEVAAADPDAEVGARSAVPSRSAGAPRAGAAAGAASSAFVFLLVSAGLLLTLFAGSGGLLSGITYGSPRTFTTAGWDDLRVMGSSKTSSTRRPRRWAATSRGSSPGREGCRAGYRR